MTLAQALTRRRVRPLRFRAVLTAGDPSLSMSERFVGELSRAGADIIELGVPFSDPVADGETIKPPANARCAGGRRLRKYSRWRDGCVKRARRRSCCSPNLNPALSMGMKTFARECQRNGVAGVLIVDLPAEEWSVWRKN